MWGVTKGDELCRGRVVRGRVVSGRVDAVPPNATREKTYFQIREIDWIDVAYSESQGNEEKQRLPGLLHFDLVEDHEVVHGHVDVQPELGVVRTRKTSGSGDSSFFNRALSTCRWELCGLYDKASTFVITTLGS